MYKTRHIRTAVQHVIQQIDFKHQYALYLDIDGTLAEFQLDPENSFIPSTTLASLQALMKLNLPVIIVTGRDLQAARRLVPLNVPIAASHGLEIDFGQQILLPRIDPAQLHRMQQELITLTQHLPLRVEQKTYSIALHHRECPAYAAQAERIARHIVKKHPNFQLKLGHCVWEVAPIGADKGTAIRDVHEHLGLQQHIPIFIGDDVTDEDGFEVVNQYGGVSIKIGDSPTQARFQCANIQACAYFLAEFAMLLQQQKEKL